MTHEWTVSLAKGCSRNYPGGGTFFFRPLHSQDTHGVRAPRPSGHLSALMNPRPTMDQIRLDPQDKLPPPPTPRTCQQNTLSPPPPPPPLGDKKVPAAHCPSDSFWNSPKACYGGLSRDVTWMAEQTLVHDCCDHSSYSLYTFTRCFYIQF